MSMASLDNFPYFRPELRPWPYWRNPLRVFERRRCWIASNGSTGISNILASSRLGESIPRFRPSDTLCSGSMTKSSSNNWEKPGGPSGISSKADKRLPKAVWPKKWSKIVLEWWPGLRNQPLCIPLPLQTCSNQSHGQIPAKKLKNSPPGPGGSARAPVGLGRRLWYVRLLALGT